jgi:hypothetical protein
MIDVPPGPANRLPYQRPSGPRDGFGSTSVGGLCNAIAVCNAIGPTATYSRCVSGMRSHPPGGAETNFPNSKGRKVFRLLSSFPWPRRQRETNPDRLPDAFESKKRLGHGSCVRNATHFHAVFVGESRTPIEKLRPTLLGTAVALSGPRPENLTHRRLKRTGGLGRFEKTFGSKDKRT